MKNFMNKLLILSLLLSLNLGTAYVMASPAPVPAGQSAQDKKKAEAAKKKAKAAKEKEKQKAAAAKAKQKAAAAKQKEADKKKAQAAKQKEAAARDKAQQQAAADKARAEKQREAEKKKAIADENARKKAEAEEAQKQAWLKQQEELETPKTEVVSLFNLGFRLGYAAMMDRQDLNAAIRHEGQLDSKNPYQSLIGGLGAGINLTYNLEYGHFLFETGLDFTWLNSFSRYGFDLTRNDLTYNAIYHYTTDKLVENRNIPSIGLPVMFGGEWGKFYFLLGAKVGYNIAGIYSQKGRYDITVNDPALLEPYGMGIIDVPAQKADNGKLSFNPLSVRACAEIGLDLDDWLQKQPNPKNKTKVKPGERLPFGPEHVHYRVSAFAEYDVLDVNKPLGAFPLAFDANDYKPFAVNNTLAMAGTKLNNLFVGAKFTIQFEVPGKKPRPVPAPASYGVIKVVNDETDEPLLTALVSATNNKTGKVGLKERTLPAAGFKQKMALGDYTVRAHADKFYDAEMSLSIAEPGEQYPLTLRLRPRPVFRVSVANAETGIAVPAKVILRKQNTELERYALQTDSTSGSSRMMLADSISYSLHIEQLGYEPYDAIITNIGDSMHVLLTPIKKGEVFIMKNLFFATNKTKILPTSEEELNAMFMFLERNPEVRIRITGHTDSVGKDAANQKLSEGRANAVRQDLMERGIAADRMEAEGKGETQPIDTNDTEEGRQNNRRVEVEIL